MSDKQDIPAINEFEIKPWKEEELKEIAKEDQWYVEFYAAFHQLQQEKPELLPEDLRDYDFTWYEKTKSPKDGLSLWFSTDLEWKKHLS